MTPAQDNAKAGLMHSQVSDFLDDIAANHIELHGFVILQHGKTVADGWWHPYRSVVRHQLFSLSKSFTSTAAGFAVSEGTPLGIPEPEWDSCPKSINAGGWGLWLGRVAGTSGWDEWLKSSSTLKAVGKRITLS